MCGVFWANNWATYNVASVDFFFTYGDYDFSLKDVGLILGNGYGEFKDKIMLRCLREVEFLKC